MLIFIYYVLILAIVANKNILIARVVTRVKNPITASIVIINRTVMISRYFFSASTLYLDNKYKQKACIPLHL